MAAGDTITFTVHWDDPDLETGDEVQAWICAVDGTAWAGCPDSAWAESGFSNNGVSTAVFDTADRYVEGYFEAGRTHGTFDYYAFACDRVGACVGSIHGTFTILPR